jgi:hypothetical protein
MRRRLLVMLTAAAVTATAVLIGGVVTPASAAPDQRHILNVEGEMYILDDDLVGPSVGKTYSLDEKSQIVPGGEDMRWVICLKESAGDLEIQAGQLVRGGLEAQVSLLFLGKRCGPGNGENFLKKYVIPLQETLTITRRLDHPGPNDSHLKVNLRLRHTCANGSTSTWNCGAIR